MNIVSSFIYLFISFWLRSIIECKLIIHHSLVSYFPPVLQHVSPILSGTCVRMFSLSTHSKNLRQAAKLFFPANYFHKHTKRELVPLQETPPPKNARFRCSRQFSRRIPKVKHKLANNHIITKKDRLRSGIFPKTID